MMDSTSTDPEGDWNIVDGLVHLREWGGERQVELPRDAFAERVIGAEPSCSIPLEDTTRRLSRRHARLVRQGALWTIHDLGSKNGTWIDGTRRPASALTPGTVIRMGGVKLVAESRALVVLRELLQRWIGWDAARARDVDRALRAVREAFAERKSLVLCGAGDLTSVASRLHHQTLGRRPFVICREHDDVAAKVQRAVHGTLCIPISDVRPRTVAAALAMLDGAVRRVRLTLCAPDFDTAAPIALALGRTTRIDLPALGERRHEIARVLGEYVREYALDAQAILRATAVVHADDITALATQPYEAIADLEDDARRLVTLRALGVRQGAKLLGISHSTLSKWATRRGLPDER